jgi:hypothetical protein
VAAANDEESESSDSNDLPGWAWALIGAAAAGVVIWSCSRPRSLKARPGAPPPGAGSRRRRPHRRCESRTGASAAGLAVSRPSLGRGRVGLVFDLGYELGGHSA